MEQVILSCILKTKYSKNKLLDILNGIIIDNTFHEKNISINKFGKGIYELIIYDFLYDYEYIFNEDYENSFIDTIYNGFELDGNIETIYKFHNIETLFKYLDIYKKIHELELRLRKIFSISVLSIDYDFLEIIEKMNLVNESKAKIIKEYKKGKNIFNNFTFNDYKYFIEIFALIDIREINEIIKEDEKIKLIIKFITFLENIKDDVGNLSKIRNIVSHNKEYEKHINHHTEEKTEKKKDNDKEIIDGFLLIYEDLIKKIDGFYEILK